MNFKPISNKFEYLNWQEIESLAKEKRSTVIWPFGAVEQHGPHLPLATDSIFAVSYTHLTLPTKCSV